MIKTLNIPIWSMVVSGYIHINTSGKNFALLLQKLYKQRSMKFVTIKVYMEVKSRKLKKIAQVRVGLVH